MPPEIRPRRTIAGAAAVLLPFDDAGSVDWVSFRRLLGHTASAGLQCAVNMDTGFVQAIDASTLTRVIVETVDAVGPGFMAGAFVGDHEGDPVDLRSYAAAVEAITDAGGVPVVFPSHGLNALDGDAWVAFHRWLGNLTDRFVGFELGPMFVPSERIQSLDDYAGLLGLEQCIGVQHSSLSRALEWERLELRDRVRPEFSVMTGNDLAIDMVCYGSDYLLGLATFAPDLFARRDALWAAGDDRFHELNDALQFLGAYAFREPVPAYRHDAAMFVHLRGWIDRVGVAPGAPTRPAPEIEIDVLRTVLRRLEALA